MHHREDARVLFTQTKVCPTLRKTLNRRSCQEQWPRRMCIVGVVVGSHEATAMELPRMDNNTKLSPIDFVPTFETCLSGSPWMIRCSSELKTNIGQTTERPNVSRDHNKSTKSAFPTLRSHGLSRQPRFILRHGVILQPSFPWDGQLIELSQMLYSSTRTPVNQRSTLIIFAFDGIINAGCMRIACIGMAQQSG
jgi:hypothetical protein